jgi:hypothetical protein
VFGRSNRQAGVRRRSRPTSFVVPRRESNVPRRHAGVGARSSQPNLPPGETPSPRAVTGFRCAYELRRDPRPWAAPRLIADGRGGLRRRLRPHRPPDAADRSGHCDAPCRDPCRLCVGSASHPPASCNGYTLHRPDVHFQCTARGLRVRRPRSAWAVHRRRWQRRRRSPTSPGAAPRWPRSRRTCRPRRSPRYGRPS